MNRLWLRTSALLFCVASLFAVIDTVRADDDAPAEKRLPKETLLFVNFPDIPELCEKWQKTSIGQLFQEPKLKPFLDDVAAKREELSKKLEDNIGVELDDLLELPQGELTFALFEKPAMSVSVVLMLEYGENQETVEKLLKKMDSSLEEEKAEHSTEEIGDITLHIYKLASTDDNPIKTVTYFTDDEMLVICNEVEGIKSVIELWNGDSDDTLADNEYFKYVMSKCKADDSSPHINLFASPSGLIQTTVNIVQQFLPQAGMASAIIPMTGLDGLKGYGGTMSFDEGEFDGIGHYFLYTDSPKGLLNVFNFPATEMAPPKWVPASVGSFSILNWDIAGAYKAIEKLIDQFQGPGSTARTLDSLAENPPMIHIKKDVLDHLTGKIHFIQGEPAEPAEGQPPVPSFFAGFGLKDAAKFKKTLTNAVKAGGGSVESRDFNGQTIYDLAVPGNGQTVSFAIAEGQFVVTNDTPLLEGMMRGQSPRGSSLADSAEYKRVAKVFPSKTSIQSFQRSEVQLKMYYDIIKGIEDHDLEGIDLSKLPPFEVLAPYLVPSAGYVIPDKKGAKTVSFSLKKAN